MLVNEMIQTELSNIKERIGRVSEIANEISSENIEDAPNVIYTQASLDYMAMVKGKEGRYGLTIKELETLTDILEKMYPRLTEF